MTIIYVYLYALYNLLYPAWYMGMLGISDLCHHLWTF